MWRFECSMLWCAVVAIVLAWPTDRARADIMLVAGNGDEIDAVGPGGVIAPFATGFGSSFRHGQTTLIATAPDRTVVVSSHDFFMNENDSLITRISPSGQRSVVDSAQIIWGMALDHEGNLFVSQVGYPSPANGLLKLAPDGTLLSTMPGVGIFDYQGITIDRQDNVYAIRYDGDIVKITPSGAISTIANTKAFGDVQYGAGASLAVDDSGDVYSAQYDSILKVVNLLKITPNGDVNLLGTHGGFMASDSRGNLFSASPLSDQTISQVAPDGTLSTYAVASFRTVGIAFLVPEPNSIVLATMGLVGLLLVGWLRRRRD